jgi:hypothetical protein
MSENSVEASDPGQGDPPPDSDWVQVENVRESGHGSHERK